jgi:hypothetical protein
MMFTWIIVKTPSFGARSSRPRRIGASSLSRNLTEEVLNRCMLAFADTGERAHFHERGAFGIQPERAAATLRRYGGQTRRAPGRGRMRGSAKLARVV